MDMILSTTKYNSLIAALEQSQTKFNAVCKSYNIALEAVNKDNDALQAKIDALMLEYCPGEMTPEQIENWGNNQVAVDESTLPDGFRIEGIVTGRIHYEEKP